MQSNSNSIIQILISGFVGFIIGISFNWFICDVYFQKKVIVTGVLLDENNTVNYPVYISEVGSNEIPNVLERKNQTFKIPFKYQDCFDSSFFKTLCGCSDNMVFKIQAQYNAELGDTTIVQEHPFDLRIIKKDTIKNINIEIFNLDR